MDYINFNWPGAGQSLNTFSPGGLPLTSGGLIDPSQVGAPFQIGGSTLTQGIQGTTITTPNSGSASVPDTAAANPTANATQNTAAATPSLSPGSLADYFARAIIIVLGFIFIAVGLRMLGINVPRLNPA